MDFNALQHKLFSIDPTDPSDDLKKLQAQAGGSAPEPKLENLAVVNESVDVPEGSLQLDKNYSCLLYTSPSPRDSLSSRMPSSA